MGLLKIGKINPPNDHHSIQRLKTKSMEPSRSIYERRGANRYFSKSLLKPRNKNRGLYVLCCRNRMKMSSWQRVIRWFKFCAQIHEHRLFSYIIFVCLFYINNAQVGQVANMKTGKALDLGSNPRSMSSQYCFSLCVHMQRLCGKPPYSLTIKRSTCP